MTDFCDRGIIVELVMEYEGVEVSVIYITSLDITYTVCENEGL